MGRLVLDSSVVIALMERNNERHSMVLEHFSNSENTFILSAITVSEVLVRPAQNGNSLEASKNLKRFTDEIVDVNFDIAVAAAEIRASHSLKLPDAIISATATLARATLVTLDRKLAKAHAGAILLG